MHNICRFLGFAFIVQCGLYGADTTKQPLHKTHCDPWEELLVLLIKQESLQPHLDHAYELLNYVNKKINGCMENLKKFRASYINQTASLTQRVFSELESNSSVMLHDQTFVRTKSITWDAWGRKAYALSEEKPVLCCFSWPSRKLLHTKQLPVCDTCDLNTQPVETFFEHGIGFLFAFCEDDAEKDLFHAHVIGYLPTNCIVQWKETLEKGKYALPLLGEEYHGRYTSQSAGKIILRKIQYLHNERSPHARLSDRKNGEKVLFTINEGCVVKDGTDKIIPWQKIEWDE
jgi:hypothetical protein